MASRFVPPRVRLPLGLLPLGLLPLGLLPLGLLPLAGCGGEETTAPAEPAPQRERPAPPGPDPLAAAERAFEAGSCARATVDGAPSPRRERDVVYARMSGQPMHLDVVRPEGPGPFPVVLLFHGGAFRRGDEDHMGSVAARLARLGIASAAVEYRLIGTGAAELPAGVAEARCAARFIRREASRFALDPDRVTALGFSAGGYFAASLATQPDAAHLDGDCPLDGDASVRGAVAYFAPLDLRPDAAWSPAVEGLFGDMLGRPPSADPARARRASPAAAATKRDAPLLIVSGTADEIVPIAPLRQAVDGMRGADAPVALLEVPGARHGFGLGGPDDPATATCATVAFLEALTG